MGAHVSVQEIEEEDEKPIEKLHIEDGEESSGSPNAPETERPFASDFSIKPELVHSRSKISINDEEHKKPEAHSKQEIAQHNNYFNDSERPSTAHVKE